MKQSLLFLFCILFISCGDSIEVSNQSSFDRKAFLDYTTSFSIVPLYRDVLSSVQELEHEIMQLKNNPTAQQLEIAQACWKKSAIAWQYIALINFGPAEQSDGTLFQNIGTFPSSPLKIERYIVNKDTSFANFDRDTRGLYALEYLLFQQQSVQAILQGSDSFRIDYAIAVTQNISTRVSSIVQAWELGYATAFINNDGTQAGSSVSEFYNAFVKDYETVKNYCLGLPLGKKAGQISTVPSSVEGFYSGLSTTLLIHRISALYSIWYGFVQFSPVSSRSPLGFRDYILTVNGGKELVENTSKQWSIIFSFVNSLDQSKGLDYSIQNSSEVLDSLYIEMTKHTRFIKSDMSSLLGISITYTSNDGD